MNNAYGGGRENRAAHGADYVSDCEQRGQWHLVAEFYAARLTDHRAAAEREPEWATYHQENAASATERCLEATRKALARGII